jgi:hypothetical protein
MEVMLGQAAPAVLNKVAGGTKIVARTKTKVGMAALFMFALDNLVARLVFFLWGL